jgi:DNA-binding NtrC family response regulator
MKVLVVDDQQEDLKQIVRCLESERGLDGKPYEVVALADPDEASDLLGQQSFDAVIVDMLMTTPERGLDILRKLVGKSPISIVLTAHALFPNCVQAMRLGAWDYIDKLSGDPFDALLRSLRDACQYRVDHPDGGRSNPESPWVQENLQTLLEQYEGEVVAILDRRVVDHDKDLDVLRQRVMAIYPYAYVTYCALPSKLRETI